MNIGISNHYPEQVSVPFINDAEVNSVKKSKKKWTDVESAQLSNYIEEFGKNWKRIAENMPGTTPKQCKYHWIRVLNPTIKHGKWTQEEDEQLQNFVDPTIKHEKWTEDEDEQLKNLVDQYGEKWIEIAKEMSGRTNIQCREHYKNTLNPTIKHGKWTEEEDEQLKNLVNQHGEKWAEIAKKMLGRTDVHCRNRYKRTLNPAIKRGKWTEKEDEQLQNLVDQYGEKWAKIAKEMPGRTDMQCYHHYKTFNPTIKHEKWTEEEDEQLKNLVDQHGENWVKIAKEMPGRTNIQCGQRYKKSLNPAIKQGKWTEGENEQLKNLVDQYGEKWAEIAKEIPGRTDIQCRQHYKKTLNPIIKQEKWTKEEDEQLKNLVDQYGENWTKIAKEMSGRTDHQCRQHYKTLNSALKRGKWTEEEDEQLKNLVDQYGENWTKIAKEMSGRTDHQCRQHYKTLNSALKRGKWTEEEDEQLKNLVDQYGENWTKIAKGVSGRTDDQCRYHYKTLNLAIKHEKWTEEEDKQLKNLVDQYGEKWAEIAKEMSGRTDLQCKQRYKQTLNPTIKHEKWTEKEDEQLKNLVDQHGENWVKIAKEMPGRTNMQCNHHYKRTLNPVIKKGKWTKEEDAQLKNLVDQHGENWTKIAKEMSGRTDDQCRYQYKTLNSALKQGKWTEEEDNQLKEAIQRIGEGQWALIAQEFFDKTSEQCAYHWEILKPKSNKKHSRSETHFPIEERPLKKFKKNHSPQLLDLDENKISLDKQSTRVDQSQFVLLNQAIPQHLEEPIDAIVVSSTVQQSLNYEEEPFIAEHDLSPTEQEWTSIHVEQQMISNEINDFIL